MSDPSSTALVVGGVEVGYGVYKTPFTAMQWQELEHQAKIYKYMVAGLPVPPDLVVPIRRSLEALSARFFSHPSLGYCSYYGKKFDPEPGRCRRTDGKKWRCSKDAHPDSKYCERHMHRGRNRSRKPVESSQQSSTPITTMSNTINNNTSGNFHVSGARSFRNVPLSTFAGSSFGSSNATKLQMERPITYELDGNSSKEIRYVHGLNNPDHSFSPAASGSFGSLALGSNTGTWRLAPSQVSDSTNLLKHRSEDLMLVNPITGQENASHHHGFEHISTSNTMTSKQRQQCFLDNEIGPEKLEQQQQQHQLIHPFFSEWPATKESWSGLDEDDDAIANDRSNKNAFSSTRLSISIPRSLSDSSRSPNNG